MLKIKYNFQITYFDFKTYHAQIDDHKIKASIYKFCFKEIVYQMLNIK